jgi:hypothetical protein
VLLDIEQTTAFSFAASMMGDCARLPIFRASRQASYETTRNEVRRFCDVIGEARAKKAVPENTTALIAIDSLKKLLPDKLWDALDKEVGKPKRGRDGKEEVQYGIDGMNGAAGRFKAAFNGAWLDELGPLLKQTGVGMVIIAREKVEKTMFGENVTLGGGNNLFFDSAFVTRIVCKRQIVDSEGGAGATLYGEQHEVEVYKTKIAGKRTRWPTAYFHTSTGALDGVPLGFDAARDYLETAKHLEVIDPKDAYNSLDGDKLGHGANQAVKRLYADAKVLFVEREVMHHPVFLHDTLHFHLYPGLSVDGVIDYLRFVNLLGIGNIQLGFKIKLGIVMQEPHPKPDGIFFVVKIDIVDADHIHAHLNRVGGASRRAAIHRVGSGQQCDQE